MKLVNLIVAVGLFASGSFAATFVPYEKMAGKLLQENKKEGLFATTFEVKKSVTFKRYSGC